MLETLQHQLGDLLAAQGVPPEQLEALAGSLLWRVGRSGDDGPVTVRIGFAGSAALFADLPRLKNVTDGELEEAAGAGDLHVEWVGARPR